MPKILDPRPAQIAGPVGGGTISPSLGADQSGVAALSARLESIANTSDAIRDARDTQRVNRSIATVTQAATLEAERLIHEDPNHDTHEEQFKKSFDQLRKSHAPKNVKAGVMAGFDRALIGAEAQISTKLRANIRARQTDEGVAELDQAELIYARLSSQADTPEAREGFRGAHLAAIDQAVDQGLVKAVDGGKRARRFNDTVDMSVVRREIREDPELATAGLLSGDFPELSPERREVLIREGTQRHANELRRAQGDQVRLDRIEKAERTEEAAQAYTDKILKASPLDLDNDGEVGITAEDVQEISHLLNSKQIERLTDIVNQGGVLRSGQTEPRTMIDLMDRIEAGNIDGTPDEVDLPGSGEPSFRQDIDDAYTDRTLSEGDYKLLRENVADLREIYRDAYDLLAESLRPSEAAMGSQRFVQASRSAQAKRIFLERMRERPSQADSLDIAQQIVADAALVSAQNVSIMNVSVSPEFAVMDGKDLNAPATAVKLKDALDSGRLVLGEWRDQMQRMERIDNAQQERDRRKESRTK